MGSDSSRHRADALFASRRAEPVPMVKVGTQLALSEQEERVSLGTADRSKESSGSEIV